MIQVVQRLINSTYLETEDNQYLIQIIVFILGIIIATIIPKLCKIFINQEYIEKYSEKKSRSYAKKMFRD